MNRAFLISFLVFLFSVSVCAQDRGAPKPESQKMVLTGVVYDINGAVIVNGARVSARSADGKEYDSATDTEGIYWITLPLGNYKVEARATWFCPTRIDSFRVVNSTHGKMSLDFVLEVSSSHLPCKQSVAIKKRQGRKQQKIARNDSGIILR
jgi:hypothetical protein